MCIVSYYLADLYIWNSRIQENCTHWKHSFQSSWETFLNHPRIHETNIIISQIFQRVRQWLEEKEIKDTNLDSKAIATLSCLSILVVALLAIAAITYKDTKGVNPSGGNKPNTEERK